MFLTCLAEIQKHYKDILLNSGRMIFRLGRYNKCIQTPGMDFQLVEIGLNSGDDSSAASMFMGLCLPEHCTADMTRYLLQKAIDKSQMPMSIVDINSHIPEQIIPYDWVFIFTILLLSFLVSLMVIASCSNTGRKHRYLSAFALQNSIKNFAYNPDSPLNTLNGVRALAMLWVIFGHQFSMTLTEVSNALSWNSKLYSWFFLIIEAGLFSVDTFFFVGGFLVAYVFLREHSQSNIKYPLAILNRYLRIVPSYFVAILLYYSLMKHMGSGPFWKMQEESTAYCDNMWRSLLFVDNFIDNGATQCMGWGWYLQVDMQLFIFSTFLLFVFSKSRFWGYISIFVSMSCVFAFSMTYTFENQSKNGTHMTDFATWGLYMADVYVKPYGRAPPYLYGLFLGVLYSDFLKAEKKAKLLENQPHHLLRQQSDHVKRGDSREEVAKSVQLVVEEEAEEDSSSFLLKLKKKFERNPWFRRGFEFVGLLFGVFLVFIPRTAQSDDKHWSQLAHSIYLTYAKLGFTVALSIILLPSLLGINSFVRFIMDTKFFSWIAKASFWAYLIHLTLLTITGGNITYEFYYSFITQYDLFVAHSVASLALGFFFSLLIEIPGSKLQRIFMKSLIKKHHHHHSKPAQKQPHNEEVRQQEQSMIVNRSLASHPDSIKTMADTTTNTIPLHQENQLQPLQSKESREEVEP